MDAESRASSCVISIANDESGWQFGRARRSVPRILKLPWKWVIRSPRVARTRMTASKPVGLDRTRVNSALNLLPSCEATIVVNHTCMCKTLEAGNK